MMTLVFWGALLIAAPAFSQDNGRPSVEPAVKDGVFQWLDFSESRDLLTEVFGPPRVTAAFGDFVAWQYHVGGVDGHDFSHQLVFRKSTGKLVSITRSYDPDVEVDQFFPEAETRVYIFHGGPAPFAARLRRLPGNLLLIAMGSAKRGEKTGQLMLIQQAELRHFHPWLYDQLTNTKQPQ
jgi:hypothetical protein